MKQVKFCNQKRKSYGYYNDDHLPVWQFVINAINENVNDTNKDIDGLSLGTSYTSNGAKELLTIISKEDE